MQYCIVKKSFRSSPNTHYLNLLQNKTVEGSCGRIYAKEISAYGWGCFDGDVEVDLLEDFTGGGVADEDETAIGGEDDL